MSVREAAQFLFIGGAEGSGTTHLLTLLSTPDVCVSLGGNYVDVPDHPEASALADAFAEANARLWDRMQPISYHEQARADWREVGDQILRSPLFAGKSRFLFKRSFPFGKPRGQFTPDLLDVGVIFPGARVVVIYRDPCAAVYSVFRRGFDFDLRRLAVTCCEHLTWLAGQVRTLDPGLLRTVSYRQLCESPLAVLEPLAEFCGVPFEPVREAALKKILESDPDMRFLRELSASDAEWLRNYFNEQRRKQWDVLERLRA